MSRVFEALERAQKRKKSDDPRDPLTAELAARETSANGSQTVGDDAEAFELPAVIGAPTGPRSNEGMILPADAANGRANGLHESPTTHPPAYQAAPRIPTEKFAPHVDVARQQANSPPSPPAPASEPPAPPRPPHEIPLQHLTANALHPRLILLTDPTAAECEQFRTLRTQLFLAAEQKTVQVIVVTSAVAGEGKTSTTLNLAVAIAQSKEKRVLVIDGDLRRPNVAAYLGLRPKTGLAETLGASASTYAGALDAVFSLAEHELYVLPVSRAALNPTELLSSERLEAMLTELRAYFDFILIDSPPVMPFADARLLANHADAALLVVRAGLAPYEMVEQAVAALPAGRILGVVLNDAEHLRESGYYNYYYRYANQVGRNQSWWQRLVGRLRGASQR